jgi:hypothetical protein
MSKFVFGYHVFKVQLCNVKEGLTKVKLLSTTKIAAYGWQI